MGEPRHICTDPTCPCKDGDACHYQTVGDSQAWALPDGVRLVDAAEQIAGATPPADSASAPAENVAQSSTFNYFVPDTNGYYCHCGTWVPPGTLHACQPTYQWGGAAQTPFAQAIQLRIADALERIAAALEGPPAEPAAGEEPSP